jgi:hypothetical protein
VTDPAVTLDQRSDGVYVAQWQQRQYRFMFDDGSTVDVESHVDSSTLRTAVLEALGKERVVGVADLSPPPPKQHKKASASSPSRTGKWD